MIRPVFRVLAGFGLAAAFASASVHAVPTTSTVLSATGNNGTLTGGAYTLSHGTHAANSSFLDTYLFSLATDWAVNDITKVVNRNGGIQGLTVNLFRVGQAGALASDNTPTIVTSGLGETWYYDFAIGLLRSGDYRLEVSGTKIGTEYTGTFTISPADQNLLNALDVPLGSTVPEPGGLALLAAALFAMGMVRRSVRRKRT